MQRFTRLKVWERSHGLVLGIYQATRTYPKEELYGLTAQLRRAAASVPANLAEGSKRKSNKEYAYFLNIAEGSLAEAECLLMLSRDLGYLDLQEAGRLLAELTEVASMLSSLRSRVESRS